MTKISFILIIIGIIIITKILIKLELVLHHSPPLETKLFLTSNTFSYTYSLNIDCSLVMYIYFVEILIVVD